MASKASRAVDYKKVFESSPGLYLLLDPDLKIVAVTKNYARATKTDPHAIIGRGIFEIFPDNPNDPHADGVATLGASLQRALSTKIPDTMAVQKYDIQLPESEGGGFQVKYWSPCNTPVLDENDEVIYIIHEVADVTEFILLKETEKEYVEKADAEIYRRAQEIQKANQELREAHKELAKMYEKVKEMDILKTQFFSNVSHELRTPLTLIMGPAQELLEDKTLTNEQRQFLEMILRNSAILLRHVNDILDVSKLEAGKMDVTYSQCNLAELVRLTASNFESIMQAKQIKYVVEAPGEINAEVDEEKIQRILMNLLSNAYKFVPHKGVVSCKLDITNGLAKIIIQDNGPGVAPQMRQAIFERFHQGDGSATRKYGGTGLGLSIVKEFTELHHGKVWVTDAEGGGSAFMVEIPLKAPEGATFGKKSITSFGNEYLSEEVQKNDIQQVIGDSSLPLVLVVEDNSDMRHFIKNCLLSDFRILTAENGKLGLEATKRFLPDLILTDVMMPVMSGDQMIKEIRSDKETKHIPIMLLTAKADDDLRIRLLGEGCQDYLMKPFVEKELKLRVHNLVSRKQIVDLLEFELATKSDDITKLVKDLKQKKQELEHSLEESTLAKELAEKANHAKSEFLSMVSHELNTPLTTIVLSLQIIERASDLQTITRNLKRLSGATRKLKSLIEGVLEYSHIQSAQLVMKKESFSLPDLVALIVNENEGLALSSKDKVRVEVQDNLAPIVADKKILRMIINNLVTNALKFTHDGEVLIRLSSDAFEHRIEVTDNGIGINNSDLDKIFQPFVQVAPVVHKSIAGIGLGLAFVKQTVEELNGKIEVHSEPRKFTTFKIHLPIESENVYVRNPNQIQFFRDSHHL